MTSKYQNRQRPGGPQSKTNKTPRNNETYENKTRLNKNQTFDAIPKPASILKKPRGDQPYVDRFNETVPDWHQPDDLDLVPIKPMYSPISTPPRLRTLITPPGVEPYRNPYNLRRIASPLPSLDDWHPPPVSLDTWGIDPLDYRLSQDLRLMRRYPSPLTHIGITSALNRNKKPYIVVPRLGNLTTPPLSREGGTYTIPSGSGLNMDYLDYIPSYPTAQLHREPSDYVYVRGNEAFANRFIEDFINKTIEDQLLPDLLLEVISELDRENKAEGNKSLQPHTSRYLNEINNLISQKEADNSHLFSDQWIAELDYRRPVIPSSNIDSNLSLLKPLDFREVPPQRPNATTTRYRYRDLPSDVQRDLLTDINQDIVDYEVNTMLREITGQTISDKLHNVPVMNNVTTDLYRDIENEVIHELVRDAAYDVHHSRRTEVNQVQFHQIEKHAQNKLLDTFLMDQLIGGYIKQNGSNVDVDDLSRLIDATVLENLIYQHQTINDTRSRTIDNYALRKFHLNSFMNYTMDLLLTELKASLMEDMKDLDEQERRVF